MYIWTSDNEDKVDQNSIEKKVNTSKVLSTSRTKNSSEFDFLKQKSQNKNNQMRQRVNSETIVSPKKNKRGFDLSQIKAAVPNWEEGLNLSVNAQLGEANESSNPSAYPHEEEKNISKIAADNVFGDTIQSNEIKDDPDFFYSSFNNSTKQRETFHMISK